MSAYTDQLILAGFQDAGRQGAWRVFTDPSLTIWVRVGSGGPPTSLVVRVATTFDDYAVGPDPRPTLSTDGGLDRPGASSGVGDSGPKATARPTTSELRPDPPHASPRTGGVGSAGGSGSGGSAGGTASGGTVAPGGTTSGGSGTAGSGGSAPGSGSGSGISGGSGVRP
jgi:hypothetical protein